MDSRLDEVLTMAAFLSPTPTLRFYGPNGHPLAGGFLQTFDQETSQSVATWSDPEMQNANPVQIGLDANGEPSVDGHPVGIFLEEGKLYKYRWYDKHGSFVGEADCIASAQKMLIGKAPVIVYPETGEVGIMQNGIGRDLLKNPHNLVPDSRYLQFKDFDGKVVVSLCDALQAWLATEGYTP